MIVTEIDLKDCAEVETQKGKLFMIILKSLRRNSAQNSPLNDEKILFSFSTSITYQSGEILRFCHSILFSYNSMKGFV